MNLQRSGDQNGISHAVNVLGGTLVMERSAEKVRNLLDHSANLTFVKQSRKKGKLNERA